LKHELDRLQPSAADTKDVGRKLRSQEATRFKSELSAYFPEYDQIMGNEPKETRTPRLFSHCSIQSIADHSPTTTDLLNPDTPIIIDLSDPAPPDSSSSSSHSKQPHPSPSTTTTTTTTYPIRSYSDTLFTDLHDAQRIDLSFLTTKPNPLQQPPSHSTRTTTTTSKNTADPLPDTLYWPLHKREARQERSIRNTEKGRAQHERDQIARLLDGLQGHDWLRVMGVSGITESKKKAFEPAREYFIKGCEGILDKFRRWAAEERRRRLEDRESKDKEKGVGKRGRGRKRRGEVGGERGGEGEVEGEVETEGEVVATEGEGAGEEGSGGEMDVEEEGEEEEEEQEEDDKPEEKHPKRRGAHPQPEPPDEISDVDASIAKQLREEARAAAAASRTTTATTTSTYKNGPGRRPPPPRTKPRRVRDMFGRLVPEEILPPEQYLSHFAPAYQNVGVELSEGRGGRLRRRKTTLAWGQPLPVLQQRDFVLPEEAFERGEKGKETGEAVGGKRRRSARVRK
jgi:hypothetical protein